VAGEALSRERLNVKAKTVVSALAQNAVVCQIRLARK